MTVAVDLIQRTCEAIVAVLDTATSITTLTGRSGGNVVAWKSDLDAILPRIAFFVVSGVELAADGDTRRIVLQFTAFAEDQATVNALLYAIEAKLDVASFSALPEPFDAFVIARQRRPTPFDPAEGVYRGDLDVTLQVNNPTLPSAA